MLVGSGVRASQNPLFQMGGVSAVSTNRGNFTQPGMLMAFGQGEGGQPDGSGRRQPLKAGFPNGHAHPSSWMLPMKGGGMSAYNSISGAGALNEANLSMGRALSATLIGSGDISAANLALIVSLSATLAGSSSLTASLRGAVQLAANLAGAGDITAALGAIVSMSATLAGAGDISATLRGTASMSAEILSYGELTPEGLRDAVWNAVAGSYNTVGTMGEKLNDAGSASNPWTEVIESGFTAAEILKLLAAVAVGTTTVVDLGGGSATVTFKGLDGATDRVTADMTGSERDTVTLDVG